MLLYYTFFFLFIFFFLDLQFPIFGVQLMGKSPGRNQRVLYTEVEGYFRHFIRLGFFPRNVRVVPLQFFELFVWLGSSKLRFYIFLFSLKARFSLFISEFNLTNIYIYTFMNSININYFPIKGFLFRRFSFFQNSTNYLCPYKLIIRIVSNFRS